MNRRPRKTHDQYLQERIERDPELAAVYKEALLETKLAFDLANFREHQGITQRELAAETGIAQPRISRLEHAVEIPTVTTLLRILRALNATAEFGPNEIKIRPAVTAEAQPNREQQAGDELHQRADS